ncbi:MAG: hypothetical protein KJN77_07875 [Gammaproteobacteria bacterium]|nr:hypothetical protein [Gammaproteobacteria bacterium]
MEQRIAELESRLAAVERRLGRLEGRSAESVPEIDESDITTALGEGFVGNASTLIGRVLLIFGGAYLLRAITDADFRVVPTAVGIAMGAAYALFWLFMAYKRGEQAEQRASALFYGGSSLLLVLPLLVEASGNKFQLLSGVQGALALAVVCALALAVAVIRDLRILAWLTAAGGVVTSFVLLRVTHTAVPPGAVLVLLGVAVLWACYLRHWRGPKWLAALGAAAGVMAVAMLSTNDQWSVAPISAFLLASLLLAVYGVSYAVYTHLQSHDVAAFEPVQSLLAVSAAVVSAAVAVRAGQLSLAPVGLLTLLLSAVTYALAFTPQTRSERGRNFFFYSTLGLVLLVIGSALLVSPAIAAAAWCLLAIAMAWFSGRYERVALSLQCTFLLLAAGISSGILLTGWQAFAGDAESWPALVPWHIVIALTTVACLFIPVAQHSDRWGTLAGLPQLVVLALSVWEVGGLMVTYSAPLLAGAGTADADAAVLAALRTAVLSAASVTLALSSCHKRWPEARWLVYPVLILVGIKLFLEDFPNGQPVTLFIALALVGSALIVVAKLLSRGSAIEADVA